MPNKKVKTADYNPLFSCVGKKQETQSDAERRAASMNRRRGPNQLVIKHYHCKNCGMWHVGHKKRPHTPKRHDPRFKRYIRN